MTTPLGGSRARRWRSRAFMQPLLVTIVGVTGSAVLYEALLWFANGPSDGPCTNGPDACGYVFMGAISRGVALFLVLVVGLLITGLVVGLSSHDSGLAGRAILVGVMVPLLVGSVALVLPGVLEHGQADATVLNLAGGLLIGFLILIPVALGFGVGRFVRPSRTDRSRTPGPE